MFVSPTPSTQRPSAAGALKRRVCGVCALLVSLLFAWPGAAVDALPDATIRALMAMWEVPGLAVTLVRRGEAPITRVYGVRDVEAGLPVTPHTLFALGSITKSVTAAALSMLADEGRFDWDAPFRRYLPGFRMYDEALTRAVTARDMLSHRTGMPRHDALWYLGVYDADELTARLRYLPPAAPLRSVFAYNNLMVAVAGQALARIEGKSWQAAIRHRILAPLGMTRARLSLDAFRSAEGRAAPYFPGDDGRIRIPLRDTDAVAPAAALYADSIDMGRYLRFLMDDGMFEGHRLLSQAGARQMRTAQIMIGEPPKLDELAPAGYGLGLYVTRYRGHALVFHPGVIDGYSAMLSFLPDDGLGMVVLSNMSGDNPVPETVSFATYDQALGLSELPWIERLRARRDAKLAARRAAAEAETPPVAAEPAHALAAYAGSYDHPAYGTITLSPGDGTMLDGTLHDIRFVLVPAGDDLWRVAETAWPIRGGLAVRFEFDGGEEAARLVTPLADGPTYRLKAGDLVFRRIGAADRP